MLALRADGSAKGSVSGGCIEDDLSHIGAETPPEIALAIMAEMTAVRRHVPVLQCHATRPHRNSARTKVELWDEKCRIAP